MTIRSSFTRSEGISYLHYILFFPWTQADVKQDFNAALFHTTQVRNKGLSSSKNYTQNHKIIIKVINMTRAVFKSSEAIQKLCVKKKTKFKFNYTMCICVFKFVLLFKYNIQIQLKLGALKFKKNYKKHIYNWYSIMQFDYVVLFKFGVAIDFMIHKNQWDLKSLTSNMVWNILTCYI